MRRLLLPFHILQPGTRQDSLICGNVNRRHPQLYFDDGDLLLASSSVDFRVHIHEIVQRSASFSRLFQTLDFDTAGKILYVPILGEDPDDWACLLGLIYEKCGNSVACPTLRELLGMIRVSEKYDFARIRAWAMAHLRADFFPDPEHFQNDSDGSGEVHEKLLNALEVIAASNYSWFETDTLTLAFYAVVRQDSNASAMFRLTQTMSRRAQSIVRTGHEAIGHRFEEFRYRLIAVASVSRPTVAGHRASTCWRRLVKWVADARKETPDLLKMLLQLRSEALQGAICAQCVEAARLVLQEETAAIYRGLPTYFGFVECQDRWELTEDRNQSLLKSFRP